MKNASRMLATLIAAVVAGTAHAQTPAAPAPAATSPAASTPAAPPPAAMAPAAPPAAATPGAAPTPAAAKSEGSMEGLAAVYSNRLAGHRTASGERFNQGKLAAAHPSLPFGTRVKVTNTKNGKSVEVRINDRGPTQAGRAIDMSRASASKIGLGRNAMAPVKLEVVGEAPAKKKA
jgi:rare lipoprotein A